MTFKCPSSRINQWKKLFFFKYRLQRCYNTRNKTTEHGKEQGQVKIHKCPKFMNKLNKVSSRAKSSSANC